MNNCNHCNKKFTTKGINRHLKYCKMKIRNDRLNLIKKLLEENNCELRNDSRLCDDYINNGNGDPNIIVNIMIEMKFYINHTTYHEELEKGINDMLEYKGRFNRDEESQCAKYRALEIWSKQFMCNEDVNYNILPRTLYNKVHEIIQNINNRTRK